MAMVGRSCFGDGGEVTVSSSWQHLTEFSITGKLMGILGLFCMNTNYEISAEASEALHYLFKILVLHRSK